MTCSIDGCDRPKSWRGWCNAHYHRWQRYGDPRGGGSFHGDPERFLREIAIPFAGKECLIWPYARTQGRGSIWIGGKLHLVTRIVCESAYGPPPTPEHESAHNCGKGHLGRCTPGHLRWATYAENMMDRVDHGTLARGEKSGNAKISENDALEIMQLGRLKTHREIAVLFGISRRHVGRILSHERWAHLSATSRMREIG